MPYFHEMLWYEHFPLFLPKSIIATVSTICPLVEHYEATVDVQLLAVYVKGEVSDKQSG